MAYEIVLTTSFRKSLARLGRPDGTLVLKWIAENLEGSNDPRTYGKRLKHDMKQYWCYRIGDYRLLANIIDKQLVLELLVVAHRRNAYKRRG